MRFKIDENLPVESASLLQQAGYESDTVHSENITGADDKTISTVCQKEGRVLLTLDLVPRPHKTVGGKWPFFATFPLQLKEVAALGFSDIRAYPPVDYPGLIVLRLSRQDKLHVLEIIQKVIIAVGREELEGRLWIVEENRIRIRG